ncbi:hypothetical protein Zmor_010195 [Zophobas morio]|uniref:Secreted protein n=1 Tax=Zophobas morio TaxID=2755281 RepID=A0AA38MIP2_9CUCU|nr:hypothetical protein Zmor_010195 [Zophobas morio]
MKLAFVCVLIFCICVHSACEAKSVSSHSSRLEHDEIRRGHLDHQMQLRQRTHSENTVHSPRKMMTSMHHRSHSAEQSVMPRRKINLVQSGEVSDQELSHQGHSARKFGPRSNKLKTSGRLY